MSGKRTALVLLLSGCLVMSACSTASSSLPAKTNEDFLNTNALTSPTASYQKDQPQKTVEYTQKNEELPELKTLTSFPGVLQSISLTLEQIITILGTQFELQENKAQGYDTYLFTQYDLAFDFDKVSKKISTIWMENTPYYVYAGAAKTQDFNDDGNPEKIIAYEDQQYNGHLLVMDGKSSDYSEAALGFFGGQCDVEVLPKFGPDKENLILVNNLGENGGDILQWNDGKLVSILPQDYDKLPGDSLITVEGDKAVLVNEARSILYVCPIPDRAIKSINGRSDDGVHRFSVNVKSEKSGDSLLLKARTSLQVLLFNNYNFIDSTDGTFCDVAQVTIEYKYIGRGKWQEQKVYGEPKYEGSAEAAIQLKDLSVDGITLYDDYKTLNHPIMNAFSSYTPTELNEGVILEKDGLQIGIEQEHITYLSLEDKSDKTTSKGLKLSDDREKVLSLYGLPDKGFKDDPVWTYYILSEEKSEGGTSALVNTMNIEFDSENVCRIWISAYVTAY